MRIIALLTDFGHQDIFVGVMKAIMLRINPNLHIVDITHEVAPQAVRTACLLLMHSYKYFPKDTIFVAVVDPGVGTTRKPILIEADGYYFIGPDNGIFSFIHPDSITRIVWLTNDKYFLHPVSSTFHGRDIFAPVAAHLSKGTPVDDFGPRLDTIVRIELPQPKQVGDKLIGEIIHVDRFGNLISNISEDAFKSFIGNAGFELHVAGKVITQLSPSYGEAKDGEIIALFDAFHMLEVSVKNSSCADALGAGIGTPIVIIRITQPCSG